MIQTLGPVVGESLYGMTRSETKSLLMSQAIYRTTGKDSAHMRVSPGETPDS
jgi:hypothetical protein